jgi:hypothetical protein
MRKFAVILLIISPVLLFAGCSAKKGTATPTPTPVSSQLSDIDPLLKQTGYVRVQLTDPALYDFLQNKKQAAQLNLPSDQVQAYIQNKIGKVVAFNKVIKYGLEGTAKIVSADVIQVMNFSYNGVCGTLSIGLINSGNQKNVLAKVKDFTAPVSSVGFEIQIPANLTLLKVDTVGVFCSPDAKNPTLNQLPISTATFPK